MIAWLLKLLTDSKTHITYEFKHLNREKLTAKTLLSIFSDLITQMMSIKYYFLGDFIRVLARS